MFRHRRLARFRRVLVLTAPLGGMSFGAVAAQDVAGSSPPDKGSEPVASFNVNDIPAPQVTSLQFTMIRQHLYPLTSPYASDLSLPADGDTSNTYTYGIYLGWEPLPRLQFYLDLEQFQGRGIGDATGLASLTDGDSIRSGSQDLPKEPYVARKVVRYIVPLSTAHHDVERAQDQLAGAEADTHIEIKFGMLSVADDFDKNRYANSTRTQFENWSLFNNTAWDFAADTRGYTGGVMLGYISPVRSVRYGVYEMPKMANGQPLCAPITHCSGQNLEATWAQPKDNGLVIRVLGFYNIDNGGVYRDAVAAAETAGTTPDITADRQPGRRKHGFGLSLEQPLFDDGETGLFARVGWNDGRTESFAFTEVDRHVSFGGQMDGRHWGRPQDRWGLGYVDGNLSGPHEAYLAAGGEGFVLGDGRLRYGAEQVVETYYRFEPIRHVQLSGDYQRIENPGFNRDRGPANVVGFRVHLEY